MAKTIGGNEWVKSGEIATGKQASGVMLWSFTPWSSDWHQVGSATEVPFQPHCCTDRVSWMTKARHALVVRLWVEKPEAVKLSTWNSKVMGAIRQEFPPSLPIHTSVSPTAWEREEVRIRGRKIWIYAWAEGPEVSAGYGVRSYSVVLPRWCGKPCCGSHVRSVGDGSMRYPPLPTNTVTDSSWAT